MAAVCLGREGPYLRLSQRNRFFRGGLADILQPHKPSVTAALEEIFDEDLAPIEAAPHAEMTVYWKTPLDVAAGAYLRIKKEK